MGYPVTCPLCGATGEHDVVDVLLPDPDHVAYSCPEESCGTIYKGEA